MGTVGYTGCSRSSEREFPEGGVGQGRFAYRGDF